MTANLQPLFDLLVLLCQWIDEIPPIEQPMRFGNKAFKTFIERVHSRAAESIATLCS